MAKAAAISFKEFRSRYSTEEVCREELFRQRFPQGFVCPKCGCTEYYPVRGRKVCQCRFCRHQCSVTSGTVMHRTHLPLTVWFWAIYLCVTDKRGISAVQLSRTLGICYDTAWHLLERIRTAMGQRDANYQLSGIVEMDDCYVGGPSSNGKRGRGTDKSKVVVAVSKAENGVPLFARMKLVEDLKGKTLQQIVDAHFTDKTTVECDGYHMTIIHLYPIPELLCAPYFTSLTYLCQATFSSQIRFNRSFFFFLTILLVPCFRT